MNHQRIGILHPGQMGEYIAAMLLQGGNEVFWVSAGRSEKSRKRAETRGLKDLKTLTELCKKCSVIISVCPPAYARQVAKSVLDSSFSGIYLDANAISPAHSREIGTMLEEAEVNYVDGGIIGNPSWKKGRTSLYLSGNRASEVAACFPNSNLEVYDLGNEIGKASAMKMCYAAYTKGSTALLSSILALSEANRVRDSLENEWSRDGDSLADAAKLRATKVTAKAWRFAGEMDEIADTFAEANLPDGFHRAAAEIYQRLAHFKDFPVSPPLKEVLLALLKVQT